MKSSIIKNKKLVYVLLADGFEEIEALTPVDYLRRAGFDVKIVAVGIGCENKSVVKGSHGILVTADSNKSIFDDKKLPDCIYIPGGMPGAKNIGDDEQTVEFINKVFLANSIIAAICAAPVVVLAKTGILKNKNYTCYGSMHEDIPLWAGNSWEILVSGSTKKSDRIVIDGNLVTGVGPGAAEEMAFELIKLLCDNDLANTIASQAFAR